MTTAVALGPSRPVWSHGAGPGRVSWSPDGRVLASVGADGCVRWAHFPDAGPPQVHRVHGSQGASLALTSGIIAVAAGRRVYRVHTMTGASEAPLRAPGEVVDVAISADGLWLSALVADGGVAVWRMATGRRVLRDVEAGARAQVWSPRDGRLWTVGGDGALRAHGMSGAVEVVSRGPACSQLMWPPRATHPVGLVSGRVAALVDVVEANDGAPGTSDDTPWRASWPSTAPRAALAGPLGAHWDGEAPWTATPMVDVAVHPRDAVCVAMGEDGTLHWSDRA